MRPDGELPGSVGVLVDEVCASSEAAWRLGDAAVGDALAEIGRLRQRLAVAEVALAREGVVRGLPREAGWSEHDWVCRHEGRSAPDPEVRHVGQVLAVARAGLSGSLVPQDMTRLAREDGSGDGDGPGDGAGSAGAAPGEGGTGADGGPAGTGDVLRAFSMGELSMASAARLVRFVDEVSPVADPGLLAEDLGHVLAAARDRAVPAGPCDRSWAATPGSGDGPDGCLNPGEPGDGSTSDEVPEPGDETHGGKDGRCQRPVDSERRMVRRAGLTERQLGIVLARTRRLLRPPRDLEAEDQRCRAARRLHRSPASGSGLVTYRMTLDAEGAAVLDSALAALSGPVPAEDGAPDPRSAAWRRADALLDLVGRAVASPAGAQPTTSKAQVMVTIPLATLTGDSPQGGAVTGTGEVLSPETARRMACDAGIVPAVLGSRGELLDLGRSVRLFTAGQRRALVHRDGGCSYPGCTIPATWCEAHHVTWWSRGGRSDLANAALLCSRHHTHVHARDLSATITATGVTWHT